MDHQETNFEKFTWKIENFSMLMNKKIYSEPFMVGGYPWRIILFPKGNLCGRDTSLSIYLEAVQTANMSEGWSRYVKFKLLVFNQVDTNMTITEGTDNEFNASLKSMGFPSFMSLVDLHNPNKGFIVKDACTVGAEIFVCKVLNENQAAGVTSSRTSRSQTEHTKVEVPSSELEVCKEPTKHIDLLLFSPSTEELMGFSSAEQIEELCSDNPSLNERTPKRSRKFIDLAFSALGRVVYFLKTRKVKDMNDQACNDLQVLWEELEKFNFDLTWLEPHVQFSLGMKGYVEKVQQAEKLKEDVVALELETEKLKAKLVAAQVNVGIEKDLLKAKGFEERDLDSELGCGSWKP